MSTEYSRGLLEIRSKAPTRIDLAGGTLDLWPLYLFLEQPLTLNLAIDLHADVVLKQVPGSGRVSLRSEDQKIEGSWSWKEVLGGLGEGGTRISMHPALEVHFKILRHFASRVGESALSKSDLSVGTLARSPAGAGLGGSSALGIALIGAISAWSRGGRAVDPSTEGAALIEITRDIETTVIQVPAGLQDYHAAMFGGLQALRWGAGTHSREAFPEELMRELESRLMLYYSGQSRNSGINNWALFKSFIDREGGIRDRFAEINRATRDLSDALLKKDWHAVGRAIASEWSVRRKLSLGISTPAMDQAFAEAAKLYPRSSGKICGAGGGGCFFVYLPEGRDPQGKIERAFENLGIRPLPFRAVSRGLEIDVRQGSPGG